MISFKEFFSLQEVIDNPTAGQDVIWQKQPVVGQKAKALFRAGNFGYWIEFSPTDVSNYFVDNRRAFAYSIAFDAIRDNNGQPVPFHQLAAMQQQQRAAPGGKPGKGVGGVADPNAELPFVTPGNFSRTGIGATQVLGPVVGVMNQYVQAVQPEMIRWIPADHKLQRMYKLLITKFSQGRYTLVGDHTTLVRNDLLDALRPEVRELQSDDIFSEPGAFNFF